MEWGRGGWSRCGEMVGGVRHSRMYTLVQTTSSAVMVCNKEHWSQPYSKSFSACTPSPSNPPFAPHSPG